MNEKQTRNATVSVGTSPVLVSEEQDGITSERYVISITNISTGGQVITISPFSNAANNAGIVLYPGGYYADTADAFYAPTQERITAVSSLAGGSLAVHEQIRLR